MRLTKTAIDGLQSGERDVFAWCSELPGFGVRCNPHGRKTFVLRYRTNSGQQRMQKVARCADMPVGQARELARSIVGQVRGGADPMSDRQRERSALTLQQVWERYITTHAPAHNRPRTVACYRELYRRRLSAWGNRGMATITRGDVIAWHTAMHTIPGEANRALALLSKLYNQACDWELLPPNTNPARRIKKYPERIRERVLGTEEVARLLAAADADETPPWLRLMVRLLLATGCRLGEIKAARMEWVDWGQGLLHLPDSKNGQRSVALSDTALRLMEPRKGCRWVIPGESADTPRKSVYFQWHELMGRAGLPKVTPHTLRHTVGSQAHRAGLSQRQIADLLGHKQLTTTARYLHGFGSEARTNAGKVAALLGL